MKKEVKEVKEAVAVQAQPTVETLNYITVSTRDFTIKNKVLVLNLANVKDFTYLKKAVNALNLATIADSIYHKIESLEAQLVDGDTIPQEKEVIKQKIADGKERLADIIARRDALADVKEESIEDKFAQLICNVINPAFALPVSVKNVVSILETTKDNAGLTQAKKKELKDAIQTVLSQFNTVEGERYTNSAFRCNSTMAEAVYRAYYDGAKVSKKGYVSQKWAKSQNVGREIHTLLLGKLQGKVCVED